MAMDIGIDLGTSNTLLYIKGRGVFLNEPSVVAISNTNNQILAIGAEAREMFGRTPGGIRAVRPLKEGVIANFDVTVEMLKYFIAKATKRSFLKPRVVICIPSCITEVEKRAVKEVGLRAGVKEVYLIEEPMAAAIGAGLAVNKPVGSIVVDIGGGTTEIAVICLGGIVTVNSIKTAGNEMDNAIIQYLKKKHNLIVGDITAESVKINIGSAYPLNERSEMDVRGRDLVSGLPKTITVSSDEIREALSECVDQIVDSIKSALEKTPPELAADAVDSGIVLAGGGAMLKGLGKLINLSTEIPVYIAESPLESVAIGAGKALEEINTLRDILLSDKNK